MLQSLRRAKLWDVLYILENGTSIMGDKDFRYFFSPLIGIEIGNILGYQIVYRIQLSKIQSRRTRFLLKNNIGSSSQSSLLL